MENTGIYSITNNITGDKYIGSSYDLQRRFRVHKSELAKGTHKNKHLQFAWNKCRGDFSFSVIEYCEESKCLEREQFWIDSTSPKYNMCKTAGGGSFIGINKGRIFSEETRKRMSESAKARPPSSPETRRKQSEKLIGRKRVLTDEHKENLRLEYDKRVGAKTSEETKEKMRISAKNSPLVAEQIKRLAILNKGRKYPGKKLSEETKRKIGNSNKGKKRSDEIKEKIRQSWIIRRLNNVKDSAHNDGKK